ncbi:DJ-1/PfpI family protein [Microbacterium ulmi]|uniref:DJ-1/PfpI family protein n=1 Tax=Microbacterium ulmi TaxID=179095 RepID=A0A7Y2M1V6_9MICO|nr:cyclohexyl-isocyanide hydratase [Microbacterium ulmi]NNH04459.1 DJ-1/PfpI family protein [Microbacterium ulmi]
MENGIRFVALVFPGITQLDLTGPLQVFAQLPGAVVDVAWHRIEPIATDGGFSILPSTTFDTAPQADVLLVPGGQGAFELMADEAALEFVRRQGSRARYVTSVCTGAFVLGAAGLLRGRRATTHWASHSMLSMLGAIPVQARVVQDGDLITGGGITSGIDFGLVVAAELFGADAAKRVQLSMEYDPRPPFDAGSPTAPDVDRGMVDALPAIMRERREPLVRAAAARLA